MAPRPSARLVSALATGLLFCTFAARAHAQCAEPAARVLTIDRQVQHRTAQAAVFVAAAPNLPLCTGDTIRTGDLSRTTIVFVDDTRLVIDQNTEWIVRQPVTPGSSVIQLIRGAIRFFIRQPRSLDVQTPFVNARVQGTEFVVEVGADRTIVTVLEGRVVASNPAGSLTLTANQSAEAVQGPSGLAPPRPLEVQPRDAVRWSLHYQSVLAEPGSLDALNATAEAARDGRFYIRRAALLLGVGRADEAEDDLDQALKLTPADGDALALRTIIAVATNEREAALETGRQAVQLSPSSPAARLALSYALQANFELEAARDEVVQAVAAAPNDAPVHARLAELWLALGDLDRARQAASRAAELAAGDIRAMTVLAFADLAAARVTTARAAFEDAAVRAPGDPLARFGLGLAKIRAGDLAAGRADLEIAASLSADDPIIRSYLGKAYFEERREPLPSDQYERAKRLDPNDPTPWLYDAIRKQTLNQPVEALQDLRESARLNGYRAVYRSRFLLDSDLAARSAALGRIYRDLGFEQLAVSEGAKSVMADPADFSGHRLLADIYSARPRHEIARVSELLQAQLLQPLNVTPLQPQLAETDLAILNGAGPSDPAFNEFHPLFTRNGVHVQANGAFGGKGSAGEDVVVSSLFRRVSFSAGQFHHETNGFRENNDQGQDIFNLFGQVMLSHRTSVQAEFRHRERDRGDSTLRFDPDNFIPTLRQTDASQTTRVGVHHAVAPNADVIGSLIYRSGDAASDVVPDLVEFDTEERGYIAEGQYLHRSRWLSFVGGVGHFSSARTDEDFIFEPPASVTETDVRHTNFYAYPQFHSTPRVHWTAGASVDLFDGLLGTRRQFNPKFGVTWDARPGTRVRAAAFRTLERTLIAGMTIEPTQVAGFNQFFEDGDSTRAWRYGAGLDHEFSRDLYAGVEVSRRELDVPFQFFSDAPTPEVQEAAWTEAVTHAFVYWAPHPWVAATADVLHERFRRPAEFPGSDLFTELDTFQLPLAVNVFHPSGLRGRFVARRVDQQGVFADPSGESFLADDSAFWVADASVGYRLPRRFGLLSLAFRNLFDRTFRFQDTDAASPRISPGRLVLARFTLAF
jgi:tetratricopeptide (TPR) repeat protein